ncbi:uncharacterized protein DUF397 [Labedaea rhizosphaerae]|uniref:Uncharacterized protein DUF397 n=1 Tax=Labedaea rhizosphaerae TaxID=598644 RepID=A0A4R6SHS0_LABRH|nr:DUF397 domain-containing protein [Labedaea rhizosphaerae]TDQ01167.1 uncharacterized protein DUF397 [Labedaea rhizosphaerae]
MPPTEWRKSSFSQGGGTNCVEVAFGQVQAAVRDSKNTEGPELSFPAQAWQAFVRRSR